MHQGEKNSNYKHGKYTKCKCGSRKRAGNDQCLECKRNERERYLREIVAQSRSYLEVARQLDTSRQSVTREIDRLDISISHFDPARGRTTDTSNLFVKSNKRKNGTVRKALIREKLILYKCSECGLENSWNDKELTLQLDHINGDGGDNRLNNLRFLCPNCHSQTDTFTGRNMNGGQRVSERSKR